MPARLLVVDQDAKYGEWLRHHLGVLSPDSKVSVLGLTEFERIGDTLSGRDCDLMLLSVPFGSSPEDPQARGLELLRQLRGRAGSPAVIAVAEEGNELTAVRALQLGAMDYLPKRLLTPERLKTAVNLALHRIETRVARRIASLQVETAKAAQSSQSGSTSAAAAAPDAAAGAPPFEVAGSTAEQLVVTPAAADFIPGYRIRATIGESEKAAVYLALSTALGHHVALKVSKTLRDEVAGRQFLEREYTAIVAIRNPSVVRIYDYGVHAGFEYLAMEYFPRGDLKARMQQGITEPDALRYIEQIAAALKVVHHAGLLHRDLKPPNVMIRDNGDVVLIDFGLARALDGSTPSTRVGVLRGSPYYMSPEQALGEQLDERSDFYGLGVVFYEMLTGRKPYTGGSAMEVLQQHVNAPIPRLPQSLAHHQPLLTRLLAKSRHDRFASAEQVIEAIAAAGDATVPQPQQSTAA